MMKSLILLALTASAVMGDQICQPGSYFKQDCNFCTCSLDGKTVACTDMKCIREEPTQVCKPYSQFKDYCNTCSCAADGMSFVCTRMMCDKDIWNQDGSLKLVAKSQKNQVCQPRAQFKDYCNNCTCNEDGSSFACTRMMCDKDIWNQDGSLKLVAKSQKNQVCQPRAEFKDYCNTCTCNEDGSSFACTRMMCDKDIWNQDGSLMILAKSEKTQVCQPLSQFKDYCNTCSCAVDGMSFACTRMMCAKDVWNQDGSLKLVAKSQKNQVCQPRTQFNDYCNVCTCNEDGSSFACTIMFCDKKIWNKNGSLKIAAKDNHAVELERTCEPSSVFSPDDCNTCICNDDGNKVACTRKLCLSNLKNVYENTEEWGPVYKQGDSCAPGTLFYSECNKCICGDSGNSAFCTFMECPVKVN